jgi:maltose O-acetyltransferase
MKVGRNVSGLINCTIDHSHCWLIEIGDDVFFAPQVYFWRMTPAPKEALM